MYNVRIWESTYWVTVLITKSHNSILSEIIDKSKWIHCNLVAIAFYLIFQNLLSLTHSLQSTQPTVMPMHISRQTTRVCVVRWLAVWHGIWRSAKARHVFLFPTCMLVPYNLHTDKISFHHTSQHYEALCIVDALRSQLHTACTFIMLFRMYKFFP